MNAASAPQSVTRGSWLLLVPLAGLALRLPALAQPIGVDQGIFATAGLALTRGLSLYRDVWDQKPPGIHLTYAAALSIFRDAAAAIVWIDLAATGLTATMLYLSARALAGWRAGVVAASIYCWGTLPAGVYSYGGFLERAVPESFITALAATAAFLVISLKNAPSRTKAFAFGASVGAAMIFKPTAIVYVLLLAFSLAGWRRSPSNVIGWAALGIATPIGGAVGWLAWHGVLGDAWTAIVIYNRAYVRAGLAWRSFVSAFGHELWRWTKTDPFWALAAAGWFAGAADYVRTRRLNPLWTIGTLACAAATIAAAANGVRVYGTYFMPEAVGLTFLATAPFASLTRASRRPAVAPVLAIAVALFVLVRNPQIARAVNRTRADVAQLTGHGVPTLNYLEDFGGYANGRGYSARANQELAAFVSDRTREDDRIYIFGMAPAVYAMSKRLPAQRFVWVGPAVSNLLNDPAFSLRSLAEDLRRARPAFIVLERHNRDSLLGWTTETEFVRAEMQSVLHDYQPDVTIEDFVLYRRKDDSPR